MVGTIRAALVAAALSIAAAARAFDWPPPAPPLPPPSGDVVSVSTVGQLQGAVANLVSGRTILIQPGTYALTQELRIRNGVTNVALRGATGNRADVVILGTGMATPGVNIGIKCENAQNVLIANLSIGEFYWHPLQLQGEQGCDGVRLYNLRIFDAGEQFVKGTVDFANPDGVDGGIVEYCVIEYTVIGPDHGYTQGVDIHHGDGWTIRNNLFKNHRVPDTAPIFLGPAVLMWSGSANTIVDRNVFLECERAIMLGAGPQAGFAHSHSGGAITNNVVWRSDATRVDTSINVWDSPGTKIQHNTVIQNGTYPRTIEYRFAGTNVEVSNNLTDGPIVARDSATATLAGNVTSAVPEMFADAAAGDMHLLPTAAAARDQGVALSDAAADWDGDTRPYGAARDAGADEYAGFLDVSPPHPFHSFVMTIFENGVTVGCAPLYYCPDSAVAREQMAVFLLRSKEGAGYQPPACVAPSFADVPCGSIYAAWIEELVDRGITVGCGGGNYCPAQAVTREQMAVFLLRTLEGSGYTPPSCTSPSFSDVPCSSPFARWIEELVLRGITAGCGGGNFCPANSVTRGEMAVFLVATFDIS
jgi:hypothetical protein